LLIADFIVTPVELKNRTKEFALRCLTVAEALPRTIKGRTISGQLARSSASVAANYRAACRGRSKAEFAAKIGIAEEEADKSSFWLELAVEAGLLPEKKLRPLLAEADEIVRILAASHISASGRRLNQQSAVGNQQ
jgi:four helix bundle protein